MIDMSSIVLSDKVLFNTPLIFIPDKLLEYVTAIGVQCYENVCSSLNLAVYSSLAKLINFFFIQFLFSTVVILFARNRACSLAGYTVEGDKGGISINTERKVLARMEKLSDMLPLEEFPLGLCIALMEKVTLKKKKAVSDNTDTTDSDINNTC